MPARTGWAPPPLGMALFAAALSLAFSLPTLAMLPPWADELITLRSIALPFRELIEERLINVHSPVYFLVIKWLGLTGADVFLLRLPSALGVAAASACLALLVHRLGGWRAAVAVSVIFTTVPVVLVEAQDARPNSWHYAFVCLLLLSLAALVDHPRLARAAWRGRARPAARRLRWAWIGATLGALGAMAMLPLGLLAVLAADLLVLWGARRPSGRALLLPWFALRLATLLLLLPLFIGLVEGFAKRVGNFWPRPLGPESLLAMLAMAGGGGLDRFDPNWFLPTPGNFALHALLFLCIALALVYLPRRRSFTLLLALSFVPPAVLILASLHTSLMAGRYFGVATPALACLAALGLTAAWSRFPRATVLPALVLAGLLVLQSLDAMNQFGKPRWDLAMARMHAAGVSEILVLNPRAYHRKSLLEPRPDSPAVTRVGPWQALIVSLRGQPFWIVTRTHRRIDPLWLWYAERTGLGTCVPDVPGLAVRVIARDPGYLEIACPASP